MTLDSALEQAGYTWPVVGFAAVTRALRRRCLWSLAAWVERYLDTVASPTGRRIDVYWGF